MPEMTWRDGVILAGSGAIIACPRMSIHELVATHPPELITVHGDAASTFRRVVINPTMIRTYECAISEYFIQNLLTQVHICVTESTAKRLSFVTGYASPPDGPEVKFLEEWIEHETGRKPPLTFDWGTIGSVYDTKANFARIPFKYG